MLFRCCGSLACRAVHLEWLAPASVLFYLSGSLGLGAVPCLWLAPYPVLLGFSGSLGYSAIPLMWLARLLCCSPEMARSGCVLFG